MENLFSAVPNNNSIEPSPPKKTHFGDGTSNPRATRFHLTEEQQQQEQETHLVHHTKHSKNNSSPLRANLSGANSTVTATMNAGNLSASDDFNFDEMEVSAMNFDKSKILADHKKLLRGKFNENDDDDGDG